MNNLQDEWEILHTGIEKYEQLSLGIKLCCVIVVVLCFAYSLNVWLSLLLICLLWLQDGIWKTFQKRQEARINFLEKSICENPDSNEGAFQFYSQWEDQRQGTAGLIIEYAKNSLKPTVAYPYIVLVFLYLVFGY